MKTFFITLTLALGLRLVEAVPYDTNNLSAAAADENGFMGWPTDPIADGITVTNYSGQGYSISLGVTQPCIYTDYVAHTSFTLFRNAHIQITDQFGSIWKTGTNGVLSIQNTNGVLTLISNGNLTISSNGVPWGTINAGSFIGGGVGFTTNFITPTYFMGASNTLSTNMYQQVALEAAARFAQVNLFSNSVSTNLVNLLALTNSALIGNINTASNVNAIAISGFNFNLLSSSNFLQLQVNTNYSYWLAGSNNLAGLIAGNVTALNTVSNTAQTLPYTLGVNETNLVTVVSNALRSLTATTSNALQSQITFPGMRANTLTIAANDTSTTYSFNVPFPDGNYSVTLEPQDQNSALIPHYVDNRTGGHFIAHLLYATNTFDAQFFFIVTYNSP